MTRIFGSGQDKSTKILIGTVMTVLEQLKIQRIEGLEL